VSWPNKLQSPQKIEASVGKSLRDLQERQRQLFQESTVAETSNGDILLFPIIQGGQFNIREEEQCLHQLFLRLDDYSKRSSAVPLVDITSGYFGLNKTYQELIRRSQSDVRVLAASPKVR
jgi:CDP-diacylglycerol--glycerol-3-phosphate 3-phosphatidyltransferase